MSQPLSQSATQTPPEPSLTANTTPVCPISKSLDTQYLCKVDGFDVWRCPESATDFVWPMPDDQTLKAMYDREAWFEGGERGGYKDYDSQTEPSLHAMSELIGRFAAGENDLCVLDVGCGYGNHLKLAADKGWKCFGIEPSDHARGIAQQRHGERMTLVERAEDLLPKRFDLIVMFEVIEHLQDPYHLLFTLFGKNAIGPETLVVISTPNARSNDAVANPAQWTYRHPPSHLVFYSAKSFEVLLRRLLFKDINVRGIVPLPPQEATKFGDEEPSTNDALGAFMGIVAEAKGSDFKSFMLERYVPGSYWKLTEYEHFPRYGLAAQMAKGAKVLDFGCGTGYGTAQLGEVAHSVVGLDISEEAIAWAQQTHRSAKLQFDRRSDLGEGLPKNSFDLVTCFEMIEHVDHAMQRDTVRNIAHLLKPEGKLVISTPDPRFTAPYGHNPYHLREMTEPEFTELLQESFKHVTVLKQWVRPSVFIGTQSIPTTEAVVFSKLSQALSDDLAVGFVAICSNQPFEAPAQLCQFDTSADFNRQTLETEHQLNRLRFDNYKQTDGKQWIESQRIAWEKTAADREQSIIAQLAQVKELQEAKVWFESQRDAWEKLANEKEQLLIADTAKQQEISATLAARDATLAARDATLASRDATLASRDATLASRDATLAVRDAALHAISHHKGMRFINFFLKNKLF